MRTQNPAFLAEISAEGSGIMLKLNPCGAGDIGETESQGRGWRAKKIPRRERRVKRQAASSSNKLPTLHESPHFMEAHSMEAQITEE